MSHQDAFERKFRVSLKIIHRSPSIAAQEIPTVLKECILESYVTKYLQKRLKRLTSSDLDDSLFYNDLFNWNMITKELEKSNSQQRLELRK
jgi:hypothetical protein